MRKKKSKKLVVTYDVDGLSDDEVSALALEAGVQSEASDGHGGKRYDGKTGHPDVPVLGSIIVVVPKKNKKGKKGQKGKKGKKSQKLIVEYDITGLTKNEIGWLASEAEVQSERSDDHPSVTVSSKVVFA